MLRQRFHYFLLSLSYSLSIHRVQQLLTELFSVEHSWVDVEEILEEAWLWCFWHIARQKQVAVKFVQTITAKTTTTSIQPSSLIVCEKSTNKTHESMLSPSSSQNHDCIFNTSNEFTVFVYSNSINNIFRLVSYNTTVQWLTLKSSSAPMFVVLRTKTDIC